MRARCEGNPGGPGQGRRLRAWQCALAAGLSMLAAPSARAASDAAYTVASYPVQAVASNAVAAKEQALAEGQQAAFRSLLKRIVPVTAYPRLKSLRSEKAANLLSGLSVRSEQNSATEYIATLDFAFLPDAVRDLLTREGVPFIDEQAPPVVLVPILKGGDPSAGRQWSEIWRGLDLAHTLTPVRLAEMKSVIHPDTVRMLEMGEPGAERILAGEYNAQIVLAAIAEVDVKGKRLTVTLSGVDAVGPLTLKRMYRLSGGDVAYAMEYAAVIGLGVLEGRWKAVKARSRGGVETMASPGIPLMVQVEFQGLAQWNAIRRELDATPGITGLTVNAVSARGADLALSYPGGGEQLAEVLARNGLQLREIGGSWFLRSSF